MGNKLISVKEYYDLIPPDYSYRYNIGDITGKYLMTYREQYVVPHYFTGGYIIFEKCDYCESGKMPIEKNHQYVCASCGAPV